MSNTINNPQHSRHPRENAASWITQIPTETLWKAAAILAISLVLGLLFLDLLALLIRPLGILFAGIVVAITLAPLVDWLERRMPRMVGVLIVYLGLAMLLVGFGLVAIPPVIAQASALVENFPQYYGDAQRWFAREMGVNVQRDLDQFSMLTGPAADVLVTVPATIMKAGFEILVAFFVSLYWLHSMPRLKRFTISLFPPAHQERTSEVLSRIGQRMGGYMRGVVLAGAIVGVAVFIGLTILGVRYALLLAIVAFIGEFFPNVGPVLAGIPAVIIALFTSPELAVMVIIYYLVIQQIESYVLMPVIMMRGDAMIPPLLTTLGVFTGFFVGGVLWAILAIPLSGAILTLVTDVVAPAIRRRYGVNEAEIGDTEAESARLPQLSTSEEPFGATEQSARS